jgi:hypothetical protein
VRRSQNAIHRALNDFGQQFRGSQPFYRSE